MKILGISSTVMNGVEKTTVTKITSKGVSPKRCGIVYKKRNMESN
jgi:hypothetical protein